MKVLISSLYFKPDHAGIAIYASDFANFLSETGHSVEVVTAFPFYPSWCKIGKDKGKLFRKELFKDMQKIYRGYVYVPKNVTTLKRILHELSFCVFAIANFLRAHRPHVMVLFIPPVFIGMIGVLFKALWRCPLVINIQDLPLDAALSLGMMKRNSTADIMRYIESWIYRRADTVVSISPKMIENIQAKGVASGRLLMIPNWIDVAKAELHAGKGYFLNQYGLDPNKILIAYAGNIGMKQGIDLLLLLAKAMRTKDQYYFLIVGEGADKPRLQKIANELDLDNVKFLPFLSHKEYLNLLEDVPVIFISQRSGAGNNFFPSKLLELLAKGKALLVAADFDSELATLVRAWRCGRVCAYNDIDALVRNLEAMCASPENLLELRRNGKKAVREFDRSFLLSKWVREIEKIVD